MMRSHLFRCSENDRIGCRRVIVLLLVLVAGSCSAWVGPIAVRSTVNYHRRPDPSSRICRGRRSTTTRLSPLSSHRTVGRIDYEKNEKLLASSSSKPSVRSSSGSIRSSRRMLLDSSSSSSNLRSLSRPEQLIDPVQESSSSRSWLSRAVASFWLVFLSTIMLAPAHPSPASAVVETSTTSTSTTPEKGNWEKQYRFTTPKRYWDIQSTGTTEERIMANTALMDYAVGTVNTMYYDHSGGINFDAREFFAKFRQWKEQQNTRQQQQQWQHPLATRDGVVESLRWLISDSGYLHDPYSKYLTRQELRAELQTTNEGFLGLGAMVEVPNAQTNTFLFGPEQSQQQSQSQNLGDNKKKISLVSKGGSSWSSGSSTASSGSSSTTTSFLTPAQIRYLPVVTAVAPDSPAERSGLTVGDRIVAVGTDPFLNLDVHHVQDKLQRKYHADNYLGHTYLTVAKPLWTTTTKMDPTSDLYAAATMMEEEGHYDEMATDLSSSRTPLRAEVERDWIRGYRATRVRLPTTAAEPFSPYRHLQEQQLASKIATSTSRQPTIAGGDAVVHYEMLTGSIFFDRASVAETDADPSDVSDSHSKKNVGYIRLTRFSRASTAGFLRAMEALEDAGAPSYIIDLRNNYGGVIQEAMLTASTLLRDPHSVLCYTMNSRGGFTPHDVEEYVVDTRYPGYLLSSEPRTATIDQVRQEHPQYFDGQDGWAPMSSFASLREQQIKRGIHRPSSIARVVGLDANTASPTAVQYLQQLAAQKNIVLLINEGTASAAEVFASALHDNGRTVALVGTKTYGKGLVQHTFPMPDGGGLRLTVAEYLTPALHHVTHVGGAQFDRNTGEWVGGGIRPDVLCDSKQGIPSNIGADLCVGMALDALEEAESTFQTSGQLAVKRMGGVDDGSRVRRVVTQGVVKDDF